MPSRFTEKPSFEEYTDWYFENFEDDLQSGVTEQWYELVTDAGVQRLEGSPFWQELQVNISNWDARFKADHEGYALLGETQQPGRIEKKPFESVLNKSFRKNVLENTNWPDSPDELLSIIPRSVDSDSGYYQLWYGPHNWLDAFPDIFRTRLTTTYFDGVRYLADKVTELAQKTTTTPPTLRLRASLDGYHALHVLIYHQLDIFNYDHRDPISVQVSLEIQVTTAMQSTIVEMLHRVYEEWRMTGPPHGWEWDHRNPAFSVNYLGSTLHYLEGMIVVARDKGRTG